MEKYRMYILAVFYIIVVLAGLAVSSSRGCYTYKKSDAAMITLSDDKLYFVSKKANTLTKLSKGNIILYSSGTDSAKPIPGRIIAMPGDTLEIRDGSFIINGKEETPTYASSEKAYTTFSLPSILIPAKTMYVLPEDTNRIDFVDRKYLVNIQQVKGRLIKSLFKDEAL